MTLTVIVDENRITISSGYKTQGEAMSRPQPSPEERVTMRVVRDAIRAACTAR